MGMFNDPGLYIEIDKNPPIMLTNESIEEVTIQYWKDPKKIPAMIKNHPTFEKCPNCPFGDTDQLCAAIQPILPLIETTDYFKSFSKIRASYRSHDDNALYVLETSCQNVFKYIATISLMNFCGTGRKYWKYYFGIHPLMSDAKIASKLYLNIFWLNNGDINKVNTAIEHFSNVIKDVSQRQMKRLRLIVKSDVLLNSIVQSQAITELLYLRKDKYLRDTLETHTKTKFYLPSKDYEAFN